MLEDILNLVSVSGYEQAASQQLNRMFSEFCDESYMDTLGNVISIKKSVNGKKRIVLDAHMDQIGLMVTEILEGGFLRFLPVGGVDLRILPALEVIVHGRQDILGIIGAKPPHLLSGSNDKAYKTEELFIDTGFSREILETIVKAGDVVSFKSRNTYLQNNCICRSALDDRLGVYVNMEVLKRLSLQNIDVVSTATVGEEIGLKGASVIGSSMDFDAAIVVDVTHGVTPDGIKARSFYLDKGPVITKGPALHKKINRSIIDFAKQKGIPLQIEVEPGNTGTNAWTLHSAKTAVPTVMLSIPLKYMHTASEVVSLDNVNQLIDLMTGYLTEVADKEVL
jgi:putative aminopeptidase FrvX